MRFWHDIWEISWFHCEAPRIEIDQSKIEAIQKMPEPKNLQEHRGLQGKLAYI